MKETEEVWRTADGDTLPPIDKEVVALCEVLARCRTSGHGLIRMIIK